jgi:hypothetical protein
VRQVKGSVVLIENTSLRGRLVAKQRDEDCREDHVDLVERTLLARYIIVAAV